jgi:hypothetical protein
VKATRVRRTVRAAGAGGSTALAVAVVVDAWVDSDKTRA